MPGLNSLATEAQARQKPTCEDGIPPSLEEELCTFGCQHIQQAGILLHLPQDVTSTAQILFQRFWYVSSMRQFNLLDIAMGALFLASKIGETPARLRDILLVFDYMKQRAHYIAETSNHNAPHERIKEGTAAPLNELQFVYRPTGYYSDAYYDAKDALVVAEIQILKRLGFDIEVNLPHALMINYVQLLGIAHENLEVAGESKTAAQVAWNYLNDAYVDLGSPSLHTAVYCLFPPHVIAGASIYLLTLEPNLLHAPIALPMEPMPWWTLFDITKDELDAVARHILRLYHDKQSSPARVRDTKGGLIELATKTGIRTWLDRHV